MFDIGWQELLVVGVVTVIVLGPKELPNAIRTVTGLVRKARSMAHEFQRGVDDMVRESELDDLRKQAEEMAKLDVGAEVKRTIDPEGELDRDFANRAWEADLDALQAKQTIGSPQTSPEAPPLPNSIPAAEADGVQAIAEVGTDPVAGNSQAVQRDQVSG